MLLYIDILLNPVGRAVRHRYETLLPAALLIEQLFNIGDLQVLEKIIIKILLVKVLRINAVVCAKSIKEVEAFGVLLYLLCYFGLVGHFLQVGNHVLLQLPFREVESDLGDTFVYRNG